MYKVKDSSGVEYGPIDLATLELWAVQGRVNEHSIVYDEILGETKLAKTIPELKAIFNPPAIISQQTNKIPIGAQSPVIAVILSIIICGLGQVYNRQILKGILCFLSGIIFCCGGSALTVSLLMSSAVSGFHSGLSGSSTVPGTDISFVILIPIVTRIIFSIIYIANIIDAGMIAARLQRGETVSDWQVF